MDELLDGPDRLAAGLDELNRERLDEGRGILAGPGAESAEAARQARARFDAEQPEDAQSVGRWQLDDHIPGLSREQQRCPLFGTAERLTGHGRRGSAAAAPRRAAG